MLRSFAFALTTTMAVAKMPNDVADKIYDCTYDENTVKLQVNVNGRTEVICGDEDGDAKVYNSDDFSQAPVLTLVGDVKDDAMYTFFLSNPDRIIPVGPIIHNGIGNIKGSDFKAGNLANGDIIFDFFKPNPPIPALNFHYCYVVFEQTNGSINFDDVKSMETERFPLDDVATNYGLNLVTSNYFVAEWKVLGEETFLQ